MNRTPVNTRLEKVFFIYEDASDTAVQKEIGLAVWNLEHDGVKAEGIAAEKFMPDPGALKLPENGGSMLFITDSPVLFKYLLKAGMPAAAWVHEKPQEEPAGRGEDFAGAAYIVEEPGYIDTDSYIKIYERLKGLPWTILETDRCIVRELEEADAPDVLALYDEAALGFVETPAQNADEEAGILAAYREKVYGFFGYGTWAVIEKDSGRLIGRAGFEPFERKNGSMSFGYIFHPDFRGKGYAGEVCAALVEYGFEMLGFTAVEADTDQGNTASAKLLQRLGFVPVNGRDKSDTDNMDTDNEDAGNVLTFRRERPEKE